MSDSDSAMSRKTHRIELRGEKSAVNQVMEFLRTNAFRGARRTDPKLEDPTMTQEPTEGITIPAHASPREVRSVLAAYFQRVSNEGISEDQSFDQRATELFSPGDALLKRGRAMWAFNRFRSSVLPALINDLAEDKLSQNAKTRLRESVGKISAHEMGHTKSNLYNLVWQQITDFFGVLEDISPRTKSGVDAEIVEKLRRKRQHLSELTGAIQTHISHDCTYLDLSVLYSTVDRIAEKGNDGFPRTHTSIKRVLCKLPMDITDEAKVKARVVEINPQRP